MSDIRKRLAAVIALSVLIPLFLGAQETVPDEFRRMEMERRLRAAARPASILAAAADYDVSHYRLDVEFARLDTAFRGSVAMTARAVVDVLTSVAMNAGDNLSISDVLMDGAHIAYSHVADTLTVTLPRPFVRDEVFTIVIEYSSPYTGSAVTRQTVQNIALGDSTVSIASQAEPYDARLWWPCKDDPADKADSVDLFFTTDSSLTSVGNGVLVSDVKNADGTRTVHWKSGYPIVSYLVSVAAAAFAYSGNSFTHSGYTMPVGNWFFSMSKSDMAPNETAMLRGLQVYSDLFGAYPFIKEKYGMAEYRAFGGAMEHQTVSSMGFYGTGVVVHELSHQWFGDKVTCADFGHIWLNEGWATYCEALYAEALGGPAARNAVMTGNKYFGAGTIYVADAINKSMSQIFNSNLSYIKGSWVVPMLRHVVGDSAFFRATRKYLGDEGLGNYRSVTTQEFQGFYERESGMDLESFFNQWIYGQYYPTYRITWSSAPSGGQAQVDVRIQQLFTPARQVFDMPVDLTFSFAGKDSTVIVRNNTGDATYSFIFPERPSAVVLDKDEWILKQVVQPVVNPAFDKGILLVNGVDWDVEAYTEEIKRAYADSCFTGDKSYTFWDIFPDPAAGYPENMPEPAGAGVVPADLIGSYCTVVWIGNAYNGDETVWQNSNLWEYIKAGGNVVLITRLGRSFISGEMRQFLGLNWNQTDRALQTIASRQPWLEDMTVSGEQNMANTFSPVLTRAENDLLFSDPDGNPSGEVGLGVLAESMEVEGKNTGMMAFLSMRPYRLETRSLRRNMQALLDRIPCVPAVSAPAVPDEGVALDLQPAFPNPLDLRSSGRGEIRFSIGGTRPRNVTLKVYDHLGREVATLVDARLDAGAHNVMMDAAPLAPGVYVYCLSSGGRQIAKTMVIAR